MNRKTLLHVEDDSNDVLLFHHACLKAGLSFDVQVATDGQQALAYLSGQEPFGDRQQHPFPDLLLLDLKLPRVNGFEVLNWIRREKGFRLPVIVLSSSNHEVDVNRAYEAGANSYLVKPVDFNALVEMIKALHDYWLGFNAGPASPVGALKSEALKTG